MSDTTPAPQDRLQIDVDAGGEAVTFSLVGELDPHTSPYLQGRIDEDAGDVANIVLDVGGVTFADSAGLRVFADSHRRLAATGGTLTVRNPTTGLRKLLDITGLADHLTVETTE